LYFILHRKIPRKVILFLFIIGNGVYLLEIKWIKNILLAASPLLNSRLGVITRGYLASELFSSSYGIGLGYLERSLSFIVVFMFYNKLVKKNPANIIFLNCGFIYWFVYLYCSEMYILLQRIPLLFVVSYWMLYPQIYGMMSRQFKYVFICCALIYGAARFSQYNAYQMYENVFFEHMDYSQKKVIVEKALNESTQARLKK